MKRIRQARMAWKTAIIVGLFAVYASAQSYTIVDMGTLPSGSARVHGLNSLGEAVGASGHPHGAATRAFFWSKDAGMRNLGTLAGGDYSIAFGINDSSQVVGVSNTRGGMRAFLWSSGNGLRDLGGLPGANSSSAAAINNTGQIAGSSGAHAVLWNGKNITDLGTLGGATSRATSLNNLGQVVGVSATADGARAFLYSDGQMQDLGVLPGDSSSHANHISDSGMVVGSSEGRSGMRAFAWTSKDGMQPVGPLSGGNYCEAFGVNNLGQVVGISESSLGGRAFLWTAQNSMVDLNNLVIGMPPGVVLTGAFAINDEGQIVAFGLKHPDAGKNQELRMDNHAHAGPTHVFLLTPQSAPDSAN